MLSNKVICALAASIGAMFAASAAQATLLGDSVEIQEYYPDLATPDGAAAGPLTITAGGVDFGIVGASFAGLVVAPSTITLTADYTPLGADFNGFDIKDLNAGTTITGAVLDAASGPLPAGYVTFDSHDVFLNVADASLSSATPIIVDVTTLSSGTPEPASWAMMLAGFAGLGSALRATRRRQSSAQA
jgi:hypothetical protein